MPFKPFKDDAEILEKSRALMHSAFSGWHDIMELAEQDAEMLDGESNPTQQVYRQWDDAASQARIKAKRPILTANILERFVGQVTGDARKNPVSIKIRPEDGDADVDTAERLEEIVRGIQYESNAILAYNTAIDAAASVRIGYFRLVHEYESDKSFDQVIRIKPVFDPWSVRIDPKSYCHDLSDADYLFVFERMPLEQFQARYPDAAVPSTVPAEMQEWYEAGRDNIRTVTVAEFFWREEKKVTLHLFDDDTVLDDAELDEYELFEDDQGVFLIKKEIQTDEMTGVEMEVAVPVYKIDERIAEKSIIRTAMVTGQEILEKAEDFPVPFFPLFPVYGKQRVYKGRRVLKSIISDLHDTQRFTNFLFTSAAEKLASDPKAKYIAPEASIAPYKDTWENINDPTITVAPYKPNPALPNSGEPRKIGAADPPIAEISMLGQVKELMKDSTGQYDASLGARSNETSGVAIAQRKEESDVATVIYHDQRRLAIEHCGRVILAMIPIFYDSPRFVTGLEEDLVTQKPIGINGKEDEDGKTYHMTKGRYGVRVTVGPAYATKRQASQEFLQQLMQALPPEMAASIAPIMTRNIDAPGAQEAAEKLQEMIDGGQGRQFLENFMGAMQTPEGQQLMQQLVAATMGGGMQGMVPQ